MQNQLQIQGVGFPPYASGHCQQSLEAVPQGRFTRSISGKLSFYGVFGEHKYTSTITGIDTSAPALGGLICGQGVEVSCAQSLIQETRGLETRLSRPPVEGSIYVQDPHGQSVEWQRRDDTMIIVERPPPLFIHYRPRLSMLVQSFSIQPTRDMKHTQWTLTLEEV